MMYFINAIFILKNMTVYVLIQTFECYQLTNFIFIFNYILFDISIIKTTCLSIYIIYRNATINHVYI